MAEPDGDGVDYISSLPDEILQHILSSLKTATAIKTSTLSKRWRHVWSGTPSVGLIEDDMKFDSINKTLSHYTARKMTNFKLYADKDTKSRNIDRLIEFAMSRNVENMRVRIVRSEKYNLPEFLYFSSSIKKLTLCLLTCYSPGMEAVPIRSVSWTSLKELSLLGCSFSDECMAKILSGCPILESLSLKCCLGLKVIDLSKSLRLRTLEATIGVSGTQIVAPHIHYLRLRICVYLCTLVDVSSLTEANIEISGINSTEILMGGFPQVIIQNMADMLQNVETLTFGPGLLKILAVAELHHLPFPSFKVKDLTLETTISQDAIPGLVRVLQNSPQLKKLTLQPTIIKGSTLGKSLDDVLDVHVLLNSDQRWRKEARVFPKSSTRRVKLKHVGLFMKRILTKTKTLEKMVLRLQYYHQVEQVEELLGMVPVLCQDNNVSIVVTHLNKNKWIEERTSPHFTMIGQSLGSVYLAWEALRNFTHLYIFDTSGYAFTYPLACLFSCKVVCYTQYPTISLDMISRVRERNSMYRKDASIAKRELVALLGNAVAGMHGMIDEHFGINVVEYMAAAGAIPIVHNSAGPKMDNVLEEDGQRTRFLAETVEEYAEAVLEILKMKDTERLNLAASARKRATRFSEQQFSKDFKTATRPIFAGTMK